MDRRSLLTQPLALWLIAIALLVVLLAVLGGFRRPVVFAVAAAGVLALLATLLVFSRAGRK